MKYRLMDLFEILTKIVAAIIGVLLVIAALIVILPAAVALGEAFYKIVRLWVGA